MSDGDEVELEPVETPEAEPEPIERGASVRDHIERALKEHSTEPAERPNEKAKSRRDSKGIDDRSSPQGKERDPSGKFKAAAPETAAPKESQPSQVAPEPPTAEAAPPKTWTKEAQSKWSAIDPQIRAEITKRENDMARGFELDKQRYGGARKAADELLPIFQRYGRTADQGMEQVSAWFQAIERNPQVALAELAKQYNVNLSAQPGTAPTTQPGAAPNPTATPSPPSDPRVEQLMRIVGQIQSAEQLRQQTATTETLNAWAANKPHYQAVRHVMAQLVYGAAQAKDTSVLDASGTRVDPDKIYERAIWMVPEVRDHLLKEQEVARRAERQAAADKARKAGSSVRPGAPGSAGPVNGAKQPKKGQSVRESIKDAIEELRS